MEFNNSNEAKARRLLNKINNLQRSPELIGTINQLITDCKNHPEIMAHLTDHLEALEKELAPKSEKEKVQSCPVEEEKDTTESGAHSEDTSGGGWLSGWFCGPKRSVKVYSIVTSETYGAHKDVLQKLKRHNLELIHTGPAECDVVLIFCVVISRVGSDVEEAMSRITEAAAEKPVVLVVMHHKRKDDLPADGPQWSFKYKNVKCHVDMVFHQSKSGLLKCDTNKQAIAKLLTI